MALTQDGFARKLMKKLRVGGAEGDLEYDPESFAFRWGPGRITNLANFYIEYQRAGFFTRGAVLRHIVRAILSVEDATIPNDFEQAAPNVLPRVRDLAYFDIAELHFRIQGIDQHHPVYRTFAGELAFELVFDSELNMAAIGADQLARWGKDFEEVYRVAQGNLRARSAKPLDQPMPGLYVSAWEDYHDAGRLALLDLVNHQKVKGEHVAMVPNRDLLIITGSEDLDGQAAMLELALAGLEHTRAISGLPLVLGAGGWQRFEIAPDHPLARSYRRVEALNCGSVYTQQKELLEILNERKQDETFVAPFSAIEEPERGDLRTYSVWTRGNDTLLPRTHLIALVDPEDEERRLLVPWDEVAERCGSLMKPQGWHPERWLVQSFPGDDDLTTFESTSVRLGEQ
jgi:hypothetical protein